MCPDSLVRMANHERWDWPEMYFGGVQESVQSENSSDEDEDDDED